MLEDKNDKFEHAMKSNNSPSNEIAMNKTHGYAILD